MKRNYSIKAVIFDMDGLMVDTEPLYSEAMKQVAAKRGKCFTLPLKQKLMGRLPIESLTIFKEELELEEPAIRLLEEREEIYTRLLAQNIKPMPGFFKLLHLLNEIGIRKAIASSSKRRFIELIVNKLGIVEQFEVIVSGEEVKYGKPNPDIYLLAAEKLNISPQECLVLEDALTGVMSAKAAKMKCIAVPNQFTQGLDFSCADLVVNSLEEVDKIFTLVVNSATD
ncbi:MAG: HAD family phosphatase [bacterium]